MIILRRKNYTGDRQLSNAELDAIKKEDKSYGLRELATANLEQPSSVG